MARDSHLQHLLEVATTFRTQLSPPAFEQLLGAEFCRQLYQAERSGSPLVCANRWTALADVYYDLKLVSSNGERTAQARLQVEQDFMFPHLMSHLKAESAQFTGFETWKGCLGHLTLKCLDTLERVMLSCSRESGMGYLGWGVEEGLTFHFPAYPFNFLYYHPHARIMPGLQAELQSDGRWKLVPRQYPAMALAIVGGDDIGRCQRLLEKQIREVAGLRDFPRLSHELVSLQTDAENLQTLLNLVLERGAFKGSCPLCQG